MASKNTNKNEMSSASVPVGIVKKLKNLEGGINPILEKLKTIHIIDVSFEGTTMVLRGDRHEDIFDIVIEYLQEKVNMVSPISKPPVLASTLGGKGTVAWTLKGKYFKRFHLLFGAENQQLSDIKSVEIDTYHGKEDKLTFRCRYSEYPTMKIKMEEIKTKLEKCNEKTIKIDKKDQKLARQFEQKKQDGSFYCCLRVDKKDENKTEMTFYGREEKNCNDANALWESFRQGVTKQTVSVTKNTVKKKENEKEMEDTSACAEPDQQNMVKTTKSDWDTPTPAMETSFKGCQSTMKSDNDKANLVSKSDSKEMNSSMSASATSSVGKDTKLRLTDDGEKRKPGKISGSGETEKYSFPVRDMLVYVYKESITDIKGMDAVTNAANERLMHGGGVAYYISKAAGYRMNNECSQYIKKKGVLQVTENYVSNPGDLKCKGIIHAVGPMWYDYKENKDDCARDLYETVKNVLLAANSKKWKKVALSAISSGLFGVPKALCAEMYIKAFVDFATETDGTLKEVHFIDVNREILDIVIDAHKQWVKDPRQLDFKNAFAYMSTASQSLTKRGDETKHSKIFVQFLEQNTTSYGARKHKYRVCETLDVYVYQGSLTRLQNVDAIAVTISPDINHISVLQNAIKFAAGSIYESEIRKYRTRKEGDVIVTGNGMLGCKQIVHIISPQIRLYEESLKALSKVYRLGITYSYKSKIRSLAMPLFGTSAARSSVECQLLCHNVVQVLVDVCSGGKESITVDELHLVNLDEDISSHLQKEFTRCSAELFETQNTRKHMTATCYSSSGQRSQLEYGWILHKPLDDNTDAKIKSAAEGMGTHEQHKSTGIEKAPPNKKCIYCDKKAEIKLSCNHMYCTVCSVRITKTGKCIKCSSNKNVPTMDNTKTDGECPICFDLLEKAQELPCSHKLCLRCYEKVKKLKPQCPVCQFIFGAVTGSQPNGSMFFRHMSWKNLPGYDKCGTIEIYYQIPSGKQDQNHPHPGRPYRGVERRAYLPDNKDGNEVLNLLRRAFDRKLVFTIGVSRTTGREDVVTWNDIHHKTKPNGGPEKFGYPDPTYLKRVKEELADKGVTE